MVLSFSYSSGIAESRGEEALPLLPTEFLAQDKARWALDRELRGPDRITELRGGSLQTYVSATASPAINTVGHYCKFCFLVVNSVDEKKAQEVFNQALLASDKVEWKAIFNAYPLVECSREGPRIHPLDSRAERCMLPLDTLHGAAAKLGTTTVLLKRSEITEIAGPSAKAVNAKVLRSNAGAWAQKPHRDVHPVDSVSEQSSTGEPAGDAATVAANVAGDLLSGILALSPTGVVIYPGTASSVASDGTLSALVDPARPVYVPLNPGELMLFDPRKVHCGAAASKLEIRVFFEIESGRTHSSFLKME
jgi:hypothetical protein